QRHHAGRRPRHASASAAVADIGIGEPESRLAIVLLLRHYAVEPDGARAGMCDRPVPDTQPIAAAAQVTPHEIEAEECEGAIVMETGNGRGRRALELANEKPLGIDSVETRGVAQPGIPAFTRAPIHGDGDLRRPHRELEGGDWADFFAYEPDAFLLDVGQGAVDASLEDDETAGHLAFERIRDADHGTLGDILMRGEHLFHSTGREPMAGDVDDIVGT